MANRNLTSRALATATVLTSLCACGASIMLAQVEPNGHRTTEHQLTQPERTEVINSLLKWIESDYILPEVGGQMAQAIRDHQARHEYDSITDGEQFARTLTQDLQAVSHDHHLGVDYSAEPVSAQPMGEPSMEDIRKFRLAGERRNFEYRKVEVLPGGVGLLQVDGFYPADYVREITAGAAGFLSHTDAVILDFRQNHGGMVDGPLLLQSYFFKEMTHISDSYNRAENTTRQFWTMPVVPGPSLADKDLFILTSHDTFSAPEAFAYDMQALGRAKIVGEVTGGGAHGTKPYRLSTHFIASIPFNRGINPITHTDYEGVGVKPDVQVSAGQALLTAHILALRGILARTTVEPERKAELEKLIGDLEAKLKSGSLEE
ncbi:MAG TPA: S41 family peptidase [Acidobacteriaceae bacterium]|nr:S41 family peptidase [Acidobacteriaceae bacterium]